MKHFIATAVMASSLLFGSNALAASSSAAQKE
ncbi:nuclear transport factor 2 family protein, partial [Escherichia coli]|nr:nuclear transport factor 2 family protein [Escherichia coli]